MNRPLWFDVIYMFVWCMPSFLIGVPLALAITRYWNLTGVSKEAAVILSIIAGLVAWIVAVSYFTNRTAQK